MARKEDDMTGLGVTFKIGPGQKLIKKGIDAPLRVSGGPSLAKPKPKPLPQPAGAKPVESQGAMPRGPSMPSIKPVESQRRMPRGPMAPAAKDEPFISTDVVPGTDTSSVRVIKINPGALTKGTKKDDGTFYGNPTAEDSPPLYKNGGQIRGDGAARVKTKGKMC